MFIFKFAGQTLNKIHFWSKIGHTAPSTISLLYTCFIYYYLTNLFGEWKQQTIQLFRFVQMARYERDSCTRSFIYWCKMLNERHCKLKWRRKCSSSSAAWNTLVKFGYWDKLYKLIYDICYFCRNQKHLSMNVHCSPHRLCTSQEEFNEQLLWGEHTSPSPR